MHSMRSTVSSVLVHQIADITHTGITTVRLAWQAWGLNSSFKLPALQTWPARNQGGQGRW